MTQFQPQRERNDFQDRGDRGDFRDRGDRYDRDRERPSAYGQSDGVRSSFVPAAAGEPEYSSYEDAEAAFFKCMKRYNVQPDWTFKQMVDACVKDSQYRSIKDPKDRQVAFEKYQIEARLQDKEREKERVAKLRQGFQNMLKSHPEIKPYTRWNTARPIIEGETTFRSTDDEAERRQMFTEYIGELREAHLRQEVATRKSALDDMTGLMKELVLDPYTKWSEAQGLLEGDKRFGNDAKFKSLQRVDILTVFADHIRAIERHAVDARQLQKAQRTRVERRNRDNFKALLGELRTQGLIKAGTRWMDIYPHVVSDPRYDAILGQTGSTPLDLFWDVVEEEEQIFRSQRNEVLDILDDKRFEMTSTTPFPSFLTVIQPDPRASTISERDLEIIFNRLHGKILKREEEDRHHAERAQRRAIDALRSVIKHLDPAVRVNDVWADVKSRVEHFDEYRALDDDARRTAFEKHIKRLKEKEVESERDRERRSERGRERDGRRNGTSGRDRERDRRSQRLTPEDNAYEADRKRAVAERERQYRKASFTAASPPPVSETRSSRHGRERVDSPRERYEGRERDRERDRFDDHDRYERGRLSGPPVSGAYDRERRDRELDRERSYVSRADPREGVAKVLDYGESESVGASASGTGGVNGGSGNRRRRGSEGTEDGASEKRDTKRAKRGDRSSKTPGVVEEEKEEEALKSGSEEGEIEEV